MGFMLVGPTFGLHARLGAALTESRIFVWTETENMFRCGMYFATEPVAETSVPDNCRTGCMLSDDMCGRQQLCSDFDRCMRFLALCQLGGSVRGRIVRLRVRRLRGRFGWDKLLDVHEVRAWLFTGACNVTGRFGMRGIRGVRMTGWV